MIIFVVPSIERSVLKESFLKKSVMSIFPVDKIQMVAVAVVVAAGEEEDVVGDGGRWSTLR